MEKIIKKLQKQLDTVKIEHKDEINNDTYWRGVMIGLETTNNILMEENELAKKSKSSKINLDTSEIISILSNLRKDYLKEFDNTEISDLKPMFQNYRSIQEKETLHFIEWCSKRINLVEA